MRQPRKNYELTGQRFGRGTVQHQVAGRWHKSLRWQCLCDCGGTYVATTHELRKLLKPSCGCLRIEKCRQRTGTNNPNFRGGRRIKDNGYVILSYAYAKELYPDFIRSTPNSNGVLEHRAVMSHYLKRPLLAAESVHHKNGNKTDNRLENLELHVTQHGKGQTNDDLKTWAREILAMYPD